MNVKLHKKKRSKQTKHVGTRSKKKKACLLKTMNGHRSGTFKDHLTNAQN